MNKENTNYLTIKEVAKKTHLSPSNLYALLNYDRLNYEIVGGRKLIPRNTFEEWERNNLKPVVKEKSKK